jgi:hypothetical protein
MGDAFNIESPYFHSSKLACANFAQEKMNRSYFLMRE